jgi:glycosyltransferase involved in cell wall biosynthesis
MRRAKIIHDNLNAGGGSERLAFATIELLNEMSFVVDLATLQKPNLGEIENDFGNDTSNLWQFNQIEIIDMYSLLGIENCWGNKIKNKNIKDDGNNNKINNNANEAFNDENYDLIINTHADLFPYYKMNGERKKVSDNENIKNSKIYMKYKLPIKVTYCHYPLVHQLIMRKDYSFLEKFFESFKEFPQKIKDMIALKVFEKYTQMINNTFIITNSKFSKQAIEKIYGRDKIEPTIIYPPVDIDKFKVLCHNSKSSNNPMKYHNAILVISRISPTKHIENAIEIGKNLKENKSVHNYDMTIVGSTIFDDQDYLEMLNNLIEKYHLKDNIKIKPDVSFKELQKLVQKSSIYIHPTQNEPFGISIVEAMSAGLIPITPNIGGETEFVPLNYQYQSIEHATEIIAQIITNNSQNDLDNEREKISNSINNFSKQKYKENLRKVIEVLLLEKEQKLLKIQEIRI